MGSSKGFIFKNIDFYDKVINVSWIIDDIIEDGRYKQGDEFFIHGTLEGKITRIQHLIDDSNTNVDIGLANASFTPNWYTIDKYNLLYIHCLYTGNHELILRFDFSNQAKPRFEYYANEVPVPAQTSHGRGGGGN